MNIAVIPARGGSKRIPRKNIKDFCGKPMIAWAIYLAKQSKLFDHVIVSTDDNEVAHISEILGAEIPFIRPAELANDHTPTVPVVAHAVKSFLDLGGTVEYVCCIYPCAPFIQINDLSLALELVKEHNVDFIYPVTEYSHPIQRALRRKSDGKMEFLNNQNELARTQDLETFFHDACQFYWGKSSAWLEFKKMHTAGIGFPIPNWRVVDIDSVDDWKRAELLFQALALNTFDQISLPE